MAYRVDFVLYNYFQKWRLSVNTDKTKIILFRKGGFCQEILRFFFYNDTEIEIVSSYSSGGPFSLAQKNTSKTSSEGYF